MVGTAYLDDAIWPQYVAAYATIPVLSAEYPDEATIMAAHPDFIVGSYKSAFREYDGTDGIFAGPCVGTGSEWPETTGTSYSTCRPQLHAAGIGAKKRLFLSLFNLETIVLPRQARD